MLQDFDQILGFLKQGFLCCFCFLGRGEGERRRAKIISKQLFAFRSLAWSGFLNSQNIDMFISFLALSIF